MIKEINLVEKKDNGDGTISLIAELSVFIDGVFSHHLSRSPFTFSNNLSDDDIKSELQQNQYSIYF